MGGPPPASFCSQKPWPVQGARAKCTNAMWSSSDFPALNAKAATTRKTKATSQEPGVHHYGGDRFQGCWAKPALPFWAVDHLRMLEGWLKSSFELQKANLEDADLCYRNFVGMSFNPKP